MVGKGQAQGRGGGDGKVKVVLECTRGVRKWVGVGLAMELRCEGKKGVDKVFFYESPKRILASGMIKDKPLIGGSNGLIVMSLGF